MKEILVLVLFIRQNFFKVSQTKPLMLVSTPVRHQNPQDRGKIRKFCRHLKRSTSDVPERFTSLVQNVCPQTAEHELQ